MLLAFVITILIIGVSIMTSMYAIFLPFFQNVGDLTDYNVAYYGAQSSIERGLLVTRYQSPGFEGSGGRLENNNWWPTSDGEFTGFSRFNYGTNGTYRNITSRTTNIPASGAGNIPTLLAAEDSKQYNMLDYKNTENFVTSIDNTTQAEAYYTKEIDPQIESFRGTEIVGTIRIPPKIYEKFGNNTNALLCDQENVLCDLNNDTIFNEKIITRNLEGIRDPDGTPMEFNILPKTAIRHNENPATIDSLYDSNLREDVINHTSNTAGTPPSIIFSNNLFNDYNPIDYYYPSMISGHSIVASNPSLIDSLQFGTILRQSHAVIGLHSNYVFQARNQQIYPFLEYKFEFDSAVSDRFYHIKGHGKIGNYNVEIYVQKPTYQKSNAGDFTIIF